MNEKTITVPKISCGHCVAAIKRELSELKGVASVDGDAQTKQVTVKWDQPASWERIAETLAEIGYPAKE
ncbi:MAG TPA: heavy metal-associated domain-containing protein [bacterium]|nr:heavy metal-associated domain-containing protein [bacterium]